MDEEIEITSKQEVLIEAASKLFASDIINEAEYSYYMNKIYTSIKD